MYAIPRWRTASVPRAGPDLGPPCLGQIVHFVLVEGRPRCVRVHAGYGTRHVQHVHTGPEQRQGMDLVLDILNHAAVDERPLSTAAVYFSLWYTKPGRCCTRALYNGRA